jgi:hypothetical protein
MRRFAAHCPDSVIWRYQGRFFTEWLLYVFANQVRIDGYRGFAAFACGNYCLSGRHNRQIPGGIDAKNTAAPLSVRLQSSTLIHRAAKHNAKRRALPPIGRHEPANAPKLSSACKTNGAQPAFGAPESGYAFMDYFYPMTPQQARLVIR